jgi:hypothetical protein
MKTSTATVITMLGLLITFGGVGTIENDISSDGLMTGMLVSIVGLLMMYCGVLALRVSDYYDARG